MDKNPERPYSVNKQALSLAFVITLSLIIGGVLGRKNAKAGEGVSISPYTEIRLPLEDLEVPNAELTFNPEIDQYPSGASLQILYVLEDPRKVPLARFAYHSQANNGVMAPTNFPDSPTLVGFYGQFHAGNLIPCLREEPLRSSCGWGFTPKLVP